MDREANANAATSETVAEPLDDIQTFLPGLSDEEYALRVKLRSWRNTAGAMIATTQSDAARQLAWMASDFATELIYSPADHGLLREVIQFCRRLMLTAIQAENLERFGGGG